MMMEHVIITDIALMVSQILKTMIITNVNKKINNIVMIVIMDTY
jgi:hypothetical protein